MAGRNSGGDLFDMAKDGTSVPSDAATPRYIPSKAGPRDLPTEDDPNDFGASNLADAATNADDISRTTRDQDASSEIVTAAGGAMPGHVGSKRLHPVPGGVTNDPGAKGSTRDTLHGKQTADLETGASDGPGVERAPGQEDLSDDAVKDRLERKQL